MSEERDTATIAGKFAEALGHIEAAVCCLGQVNEQYDPAHDPGRLHIDDIRSRFCNLALDFWLQAELAEDALKGILDKLQRVEPLAPRGEPRHIGGWSERMQQLMEAIGRHPAAESDPDVIDAINAMEDALRQKEAG